MSDVGGGASRKLVGVDPLGDRRAYDRGRAPFYTQQLGLAVTEDEVLSSPAVRLVYLDAGNITLQIVEPSGPGRVAAFIDEHGEGMHHICIGVDRIEASLAAVGARGDPEVVIGGRGRRACFLHEGPSGVVIELTETAATKDGAGR